MALPRWARRIGIGAGGQISPEELGLYPTSTQITGLTEGRSARLEWSRTTPAGLVEDLAQTSFEFINTTAGAIDNTWTDADFTTLETAIDTWWSAIRGICGPGHALNSIRWYAFGPSLPLSPQGNEMPGAPRRVVARTLGGTGVSTALIYQMAMTITHRTAARKRWGRNYVPGLTAAPNVGGDGRFTLTARDIVANATQALFNTAADADFAPVVYSRARRMGYGIETISVDDVPDVQRRRRPKMVGARSIRNT